MQGAIKRGCKRYGAGTASAIYSVALDKVVHGNKTKTLSIV